MIIPAGPNANYAYEIHRPRSNSKMYKATINGEAGLDESLDMRIFSQSDADDEASPDMRRSRYL